METATSLYPGDPRLPGRDAVVSLMLSLGADPCERATSGRSLRTDEIRRLIEEAAAEGPDMANRRVRWYKRGGLVLWRAAAALG